MFSFHHHHHQMSNPYDMSQPSQKWKPSVEIAPNCPRCNSPNTKFCYYNNYSLTQPRYFCKGCRRYWTKGGSLRNVPVGGGCRKNRRFRSSRIMSSSMTVRKSSSEPLIRPDQALNDMVGGSSQGLTVDDASTIDLAMLYNKFLNQSPASEPEPVWASSDPDPDQNNDNIELGEFNYLLDSGGFGQLAIPTTVGTTDVFPESFFPNMQCPVAPEQQGWLGEDFVHGDWCGSLDVHSNFGTFFM